MVLKSAINDIFHTLRKRFRPLAGFLLLSFPRRYGGSGEQREPIGALVACVHF